MCNMADNMIQLFLSLLRAGLWEQEVRHTGSETFDFVGVYQLAKEQAVVGTVAAGLEHVENVKVPQDITLAIVGDTLLLEQRNLAMNFFIGDLYKRLEQEGIHSLLVKGQGIAQCYERPLWRTCGDVDLMLDNENYERAKDYFDRLFKHDGPEVEYRKHISYSIYDWEVELHGSLRGCFLKRVDKVLDDVQNELFLNKCYRIWKNGDFEIRLLAITYDVVFVFTHILQHFFIEGVGLRQICDWCRLIWKYQTEIDLQLLESLLKKMQLMTEWKVFASLAVHHLGMPEDSMPFYSPERKWRIKSDRVLSFIIRTGSFGRNRITNGTFQLPYLVRKIKSLFRHTMDGTRFFLVFPMDAPKVWWNGLVEGVKTVVKSK